MALAIFRCNLYLEGFDSNGDNNSKNNNGNGNQKKKAAKGRKAKHSDRSLLHVSLR